MEVRWKMSLRLYRKLFYYFWNVSHVSVLHTVSQRRLSLCLPASQPCFSVVSHRGHSHPGPLRTDQPQCTGTPARLAHTSGGVLLHKWPLSANKHSLLNQTFSHLKNEARFCGHNPAPPAPLFVVSRHDGDWEAGDDEAEGGGGQAEGRDPSEGPRADAEKWGHRSSKATQAVLFATLFALIQICGFAYKNIIKGKTLWSLPGLKTR